MKFTIFGIWEKIYKKVILFILIFVTISSIFMYLSLNQENINLYSFLISFLYALFLFCVDLYYNYMKNIINEKFYDRKDYYMNLFRLKELFNSSDINSLDYNTKNDENVYMSIIDFRIFTGRIDNKELKKRPYIIEKGFHFDLKELEFENEFIANRDKILDIINKDIEQYIKEKKIKTNSISIPITNKVYFNFNKFFKSYGIKNLELKKITNHMKTLFKKINEDILNYNELINSVIKKYFFYKKQINKNIARLESTYGNKLKYEIEKDHELINRLIEIEEYVSEIKNELCSYGDIEGIVDSLLDSYTEELKEGLYEINNSLSDEINNAKEEIIEAHIK